MTVILALYKDKIANVRMNVAKALKEMQPTVKGQGDLEDKFKSILKDLSNDSDFDVVYYAK